MALQGVVVAMLRALAHLGGPDAVKAAVTLAGDRRHPFRADAAEVINPSGNAAVGSDHQRQPRLHGAKYAASQMHVELTRAPVPGVVGHVHQGVGVFVAILQRRHLTPNNMRNCRLVTNVRRETIHAVESQCGRRFAIH